jgi:hypothetical protein
MLRTEGFANSSDPLDAGRGASQRDVPTVHLPAFNDTLQSIDGRSTLAPADKKCCSQPVFPAQFAVFMRRQALVLVLLTMLTFSRGVFAAERTWSGGGRSTDWTDEANWTALGGAPAAGDALRFPVTALRTANHNDYPAGTAFNRLTYAGADYVTAGNSIRLSAGIFASHDAGSTVVNSGLTLAADQAFTVTEAGAALFLNGPIALEMFTLTFDGAGHAIVVGNVTRRSFGRGALHKQGPGRLTIFQHPIFDGDTMVSAGTLAIEGSLSNSVVTLSGTSTLTGSGKILGLAANSGTHVRPGGNAPEIFDILENANLNVGSTLQVRLNGTTAGLNYDQLRVQGTVSLGGSLIITGSYVPVIGDRFTIIGNEGTNATMGIFAVLPEGSILSLNGRPLRLAYGSRFVGSGRDGNDVTLEAVPARCLWDEGGDGSNWTDPLNWSGDIAPKSGDDLDFTLGSVISFNDYAAGQVFGSLRLGNDVIRLEGNNLAEFQGPIEVVSNGLATIHFPLRLRSGIRHQAPAGTLTLRGTVTLATSETFLVVEPEGKLNLNGPLVLDGHTLIVDGAGATEVRGYFQEPITCPRPWRTALCSWNPVDFFRRRRW